NRRTFTQHSPASGSTQDAVTTQTFTAPGTGNTGNGNGGPHALTSLETTVNGSTTAYATNSYDQAGNTTAQYTYAAGTTDLTWSTEGKLDTYRPTVQIQGIAGKCLAMQGGSSANSTPAEIANCDATSGQKFATGGNKLKVFGACLTAMGTAAGSAIQLQPCTGATSQTWTTRDDGTIANAAANLCLAVPGDVTTNGTDVLLAACGTTVPAGQKWTLPHQSTTYATSSSPTTPAKPPSPSGTTNSPTPPPPPQAPPAPATTRCPAASPSSAKAPPPPGRSTTTTAPGTSPSPPPPPPTPAA
ncbi:RICIN domain-containing protein, partial [Kitasatospora nipponensis]|uniref:RICIN domain-containing protein n=1 Tax=Kitasatospora nipponensis TaxID=258049 RepID=UPI0031D3C3F7